MKTTLTAREENTARLELEVEAEELQQAFNDRVKQLTKEIRIPGFRSGKVPAAFVRQRLGDEAVLQDTLEEYLPRWYSQGVAEVGLNPVDRPEITLQEEQPELGKPLTFKVEVTVMPSVQLGQYKGLEVPREQPEVRDEEVDAHVDRLREEFAELRPVEGRPVQKGDYVTVDFSASLEGEPVEAMIASDFVFEVGSDRLLPEIEEQVPGMNAGEERTFPLSLPPDFAVPDAAGKTVEFKITVKDVKEKILPPQTDKFAEDVSEFGTLLELRQDIRKRIKAGKEMAEDRAFRARAVRAATDAAVLDLPDVVVKEQAEEMVGDFKRSFEAAGGEFDRYLEARGVTMDKLVDEMRPEAALNVKTGLMLDAVVEAEGIEVSDEDVKKAVERAALASRLEPAVYESRLKQSGRIEAVRWQILRDKAADLIASQAVAVAPPQAADGSPSGEGASASIEGSEVEEAAATSSPATEPEPDAE